MTNGHLKVSNKSQIVRKHRVDVPDSFNSLLGKNKTTANQNLKKGAVDGTTLISARITKDRLVKYARALAECPDTGVCSNNIAAAKLVDSLQNSVNFRPSGRTGLPNYNYDDFAALAPKFGNAFARQADSINPDFSSKDPLKVWILNEDKPFEQLIQIVSQAYSDAPSDEIEVPLTEYVPALFKAMGGTESQISQDKFVDFMWRKQ